jgi:nitrite reductase/ring-hydroxylating ferredoxin subunit
VAPVGDCPPGRILGVAAGSERIVIANVEGDFYALLDRCSHQDYPLSDGELDGTRLECIYHGAKFDVCTGRAMQLPAIRPVKTFPVEVREGSVFVEV